MSGAPRTRARGGRPLAVAIALAALLGASDAGARGSTMLQDLMKRLDGLAATGNTKMAAEVLRVVKVMGPPEYKGWPLAADKARAAALAGNVAAMKRACDGCHDPYRSPYKNKYGSGAGDGEDLPRPRD